MITLDASVVIAAQQTAQVHHDQAVAYLEQHAGADLLLHPLTLAEILTGGARVGRAEEMWSDLRAMGIRVATGDDSQPLRLAALRAATGLKLPDCCVLDTAISAGSALATTDERLARAGRQRGLAVGP